MPTRAQAPIDPPLRFVTIDVEEAHQIEAAYGVIPKSQWDRYPARVERNIDLLLQLFDRRGQRGTFFVLGDVARRSPAAVRAIVAAGHEVASHGDLHDKLNRLNPQTFRDDLARAKASLEDLIQKPVIGYRAPSFSLTRNTAWAVDVLVEQGFIYDASIFPIGRDNYGVADAPHTPFYLKRSQDGPRILEIPALVWRTPFRNIPVAGGGYFRLLPLGLMKAGLRQAAAEKRPAMLYFHPWEFDADQPRLPLSLKSRIRTYTGVKAAPRRLDRILAIPAQGVPVAEALDQLRAHADDAPPFVLESPPSR